MKEGNMFALRIDGRDPLRIQGGVATIGRESSCEVVIDRREISKRHARIEKREGRHWLSDLGSTNGTWRHGERIEGRVELSPGDVFSVGTVAVEVLSLEPVDLKGLRDTIHDRLLVRLDLRRQEIEKLDEAELRDRTEKWVATIVGELDAEGAIPPGVDRPGLCRDVVDEALGLGPLEPLLADEEISEILVNHADQIYVERKGRLERSERRFSSNEALRAVIERIVGRVGRRIDESSPLVDARLPDGSRVNAVVPPLALKGPCLSIRKFRRIPLGIEELIRMGTLTEQMAAFLSLAVRNRASVVISGGTGSGKTTLLNVLTSFIPADERILTIEDAAELQIRQPHWVQLESRPANLEGKGAIPIRDLVRNSLRMRPDRIVVGECRSGEALDMLQAMNTGHDGSLTTLHANGPREALARLETLCLLSGVELPLRAIREQIARAVHLIIQQSRFPDGSRRITHVTEVAGIDGEVITLQEVFRFDQEGYDPQGKVVGRHVAGGFVPRFVERLREQGEDVDLSMFRGTP